MNYDVAAAIAIGRVGFRFYLWMKQGVDLKPALDVRERKIFSERRKAFKLANRVYWRFYELGTPEASERRSQKESK